MTGIVQMLISKGRSGEQTHVYSVMFTPTDPTGKPGFLESKDFLDVESLGTFLKSMRIDGPSIQDALEQVEVRGNASVPHVELSQEELTELGLK
jgi:hypothetical protein